MSAFMCSPLHIATVARAICEAGEAEGSPVVAAPFTVADIYEILYFLNVDSIRALYGDVAAAEALPMPAYSEPAFHGIATVGKACACYAYQACESPRWNEHRIRVLVEALRAKIEATVPRAEWDAAPWGI